MRLWFVLDLSLPENDATGAMGGPWHGLFDFNCRTTLAPGTRSIGLRELRSLDSPFLGGHQDSGEVSGIPTGHLSSA